MTALQKLLGVVLALVWLTVALLWWRVPSGAAPVGTRTAGTQLPDTPPEPIDSSAYANAQRLTALADDGAEQHLAQSALRLADHQLDLAFAMALRQLDAHPQALTVAGQAAQAHLEHAQAQLVADQRREASLVAAAAQKSTDDRDSLQDQLDLAHSQVELDKFEIDQANQDLEDAGGNLRRRIEAQVQKHEAAEHSSAGAGAGAGAGANAAVAARPAALQTAESAICTSCEYLMSRNRRRPSSGRQVESRTFWYEVSVTGARSWRAARAEQCAR